jgi:ATP-binding cassette subfamily B protein
MSAEVKLNSLIGNLREAMAKTSYWPRTMHLIWESAKGWTIAWAVLLVLQGIQPLAAVYLTKLLIDSLVKPQRLGSGWERLRPSLVLIILTIGVMLLAELLQSITEYVRTNQSELVQDHIKALVHQQSATMDLSTHESHVFQDQLDRARSEASARPLALLESCGSLVQSSITLVAMAAVLLPLGLWLPIILLVSTLPAFLVLVRFDRRYHRWWLERTPQRRRTQYYDLILTHSVTAPELRLFGLYTFFQSGYQELRRLLRDERLQQVRAQGLAKLGASALAQVVGGVTLLWMVSRAIRGGISLGDLALFYQAFSRGQGLLRTVLGNLGQIYSNSLFLENLLAFLDLKPKVTDPIQPALPLSTIKEGIAFRQVTFRYPGADQPALRNFDLFVPAGKIVAIVGANGAGKTTLLKLLCRFYDPEAGKIEIDGIDIREFSLDQLRRMMTVLFQFPLSYQDTAYQSIAMGDLASAPGMADIEAAAMAAGAHDLIQHLPRGYDTPLGKAFADGVELSGGEWHRISTARAYLRRSPVILLDEPTSMLDSWTETDWFERFRALAHERTALMITHRFTIAMRADAIHVLHDGEVVESGSHAQLLSKDGLYAQSWTAQMKTTHPFEEPAPDGVTRYPMSLNEEPVEV